MDSRLRDHVIRLADLNFGWIPLYLFTWVLQWFTWAFRYFAILLVLVIVNWITGWNLPAHYLALIVGFGPLAISLATLVLPLGSWWFEQQMGARKPSEREQAVFELAFEELREADPNLRPPHRWSVLDEAAPNGYSYADILLVTRGALEIPSFAGLLAHELGHLNSSDARVTAAIYRIITWPREPLQFPFRLLGFLVSGRIGFWPMQWFWPMYWRRREIRADEFAAKLGQKAALGAHLDVYALEGDLPTPFKAFGTSSHPWTEHRIDKLETP
jgi:Zn-dependent protease with chaperone function